MLFSPGLCRCLTAASLAVTAIGCGSETDLFDDGAGGAGGETVGGAGGMASGGTSSGGSGGGGMATGGMATGGMGSGGMATGGMGSGGAGGACDLNGLQAPDQVGFSNGLDGITVYNGTSDLDDNLLVVEFWHKYGAASSPHTFTFTGENYLDCHTCAILMTDCNASDECNRRFLVESGTLTVTALDATTLTATLENIVATEVTITDAVSTPVPNGETWCVDSHSISTTLDVLPFDLTKP